VNLHRGSGPPLVIGHRGAAAAAPENTLAALQAGVDAGAALVEFDIGPDLRLAHSSAEVPHEAISLDEALDFLRAHDVGLHLDVKLPGYEDGVVAAVRRHALVERSLVSTAWPVSTRRLARLAPELPRAIGYPHDRYDLSKRIRWPAVVNRCGAFAMRRAMPARLPLLLRRAQANVLSLHHTLCSRAAVTAVHRLGVPVLAWTANDPAVVRRLAAAGVDAIVSDDPKMAVATLAAS
jgi:glycerophosphoryl diester phosphodiesterase